MQEKTQINSHQSVIGTNATRKKNKNEMYQFLDTSVDFFVSRETFVRQKKTHQNVSSCCHSRILFLQ